ncbi:DNA-directed RNA polymerase sigma-70 factor [Oceaniferula spumae]|uniref:DNA-directed RNA polymerase sigma-70 factor n=1 Tax=Oceaniferula spumae TaxID=2979115 RepID=A0AAT9FNQ4_9BACT
MSDLNIEYLQLVTRHQAAIYGYIRSIAPGIDTEDVLQETNIILWDKADQFEPSTNFKAFAFRIAHLKTLECLRQKKREHWLQFDTDLLEAVARFQTNDLDQGPGRQHALRHCLAQLPDDDRELIHARYTKQQTVRSMAKNMNRTEGSLQQLFFRLRNSLKTCIERELLKEGEATT